MPVIPTLRSLHQENLEFKASLNYTARCYLINNSKDTHKERKRGKDTLPLTPVFPRAEEKVR